MLTAVIRSLQSEGHWGALHLSHSLFTSSELFKEGKTQSWGSHLLVLHLTQFISKKRALGLVVGVPVSLMPL